MPSQRGPDPDVAVIGGGIGGLTAAVDLATHGFSVHLIEQKQHCGGRTYSFVDKETGDEVDNGQHLMMGCYHSTLKYLSTIGTLQDVTIQKKLSVVFRHEHRGAFRLQAAPLPAPLNVVAGMLRLKSLSLSQRLSLLRVGAAIASARPDADERLHSMTVTQWLDALHQSPENKKYLWNIIAIGTLNDSPDVVSAALFVKVLKSAFLGKGNDSSMAIPIKGLSKIFVDEALEYLMDHRCAVRMNTQVERIVIENKEATALVLQGGERIVPRAIVCSAPYYDLRTMFDDDGNEIFGGDLSGGLIASAIVTIHCWFDRRFMEEDFVALLDSPVHWVFNKSAIFGKRRTPPYYLSLVISGASHLVEKDKGELTEMALAGLRRFYPESAGAKLVHSLVIKEKRATFSPRVGTHKFRPAHATSVKNLFLAGDWTDTKLPATIEGAAQSGYACSELVREYLKRKAQ
ncbi:MAG TPA: hydroxysqualene dehydroxylase HpnE [Bacteroidota bacterium]|nr:hydroxysqualene dehydroxylase HpnE [Bacteroidota bacterium]